MLKRSGNGIVSDSLVGKLTIQRMQVADLTDEAIDFARTWQALSAEQRVAMKAAVESLASK